MSDTAADLRQEYFLDYVVWKLKFMDDNPDTPICRIDKFDEYLKKRDLSPQDEPKVKKRKKKK